MKAIIKKKKKEGRPTKYNEKTVKKILSILQMGGTVEQACAYAKIRTQSFYTWLKQYPEFFDDVESAKHYLSIAAKNVVGQKILKDEDDKNARWWLEKNEFKDDNKLNLNIVNNNITVEDEGELDEFLEFRKAKHREIVEAELVD